MKVRKKFLSLLIIGVMAMSSVVAVSAATTAPTYGYNFYKTSFNYAEGAPSSTYHISQSVDVLSNVSEYAYARCDSYEYQGNQPTLTITSGDPDFPTYSVSFTSKDTVGRAMKYTEAIPIKGEVVKFNGVVTGYGKSFTIIASVKG